ncbi:MAG: 30S ribosomal protein S20, partial [Erysipelotrichaceae bacterium]|nr:30S ribosomal protein S20 [Erysipelotrichaceae bacterium]
NEVSSKLDKSITSNIHHKNYVSRQKARLSKAVNSIN